MMESRSHGERDASAVWGMVRMICKASDLVISISVGIIATLLVLYASYVLYDTLATQEGAFASSHDTLRYKPDLTGDSKEVLGASDLKRENDDYRAWLTVYGTHIDYPVMQGEDDLFYASRDILGQTSLMGAIYLAAHCSPDLSDSYSLVYGHDMDNGGMFGDLRKYLEQDYYEGHRKGLIVREGEAWDLHVFAVVKTDAYEGKVYGPSELSDSLRDYISSHAVFLDAEAMAGAKKVIALSTCMDARTNGRLVLFAAMVPHEGAFSEEARQESEADGNGQWKPDADRDPGNLLQTGVLLPSDLLPWERHWALLNLLSVIVTACVLFPVPHARSKFRRAGVAEELNEEAGREVVDADAFRRRFQAGVLIECTMLVASLVLFVWTEDFMSPICMIDGWTPVMLVLMVGAVIADILLARLRVGDWDEDESGDASVQANGAMAKSASLVDRRVS